MAMERCVLTSEWDQIIMVGIFLIWLLVALSLSWTGGGGSPSLVEHGVGVAGGFPDVALIY